MTDTADILFLPGELGGWNLECDDVEQASDGGWDVSFISYTAPHPRREDTNLRVAIVEDDDGYEVGAAIAHTDHLESEMGIDDLDDALKAMVDLMATHAPSSELLAMADDMGSTPVISR